MKKVLLLLTLATSYHAYAQNEYEYPVDPETKKITYEKSISVSDNKHILYKDAQQFIASQNFDKELVIKTKARKLYWSGNVVERPVTYQDEETGKLFGNGYIPFSYRGNDRFVITFSYKLYVKDNQYRYIFTDFIVKEFVDGGKSVGKSHMTGSTSSKNSSARILSFPLEEFIERNKYEKSEHLFSDQIGNLKHQLKLAMTGKL